MKHNFTKLTAEVKLTNADGQAMTYNLVGPRMNEKELSEVPEYLAKLARIAMTGVEDKDLNALKTQLAEVKAKHEKLTGELDNASKEIAELKKKK